MFSTCPKKNPNISDEKRGFGRLINVIRLEVKGPTAMETLKGNSPLLVPSTVCSHGVWVVWKRSMLEMSGVTTTCEGGYCLTYPASEVWYSLAVRQVWN